MSRSSDTLMAFLLGAVAGGVVALLLAPEKGSVTRERIRQGANDAYGRSRDWVDETQEELRSRAGEISGRARERARDVADAARGRLDSVKGAVAAGKDAIAEGKEAYRREMEKKSEA